MAESKENVNEAASYATDSDGFIGCDFGLRYLIVNPEKGGVRDLLKYTVTGDIGSFAKFVDTSDEKEGNFARMGWVAPDHRWVIVVSIVVRKILACFAKPLKWTGYLVDFLLNLLSQNGGLFGLIYNIFRGALVIPRRDTEAFISSVGHIDGRVDLYKGQELAEANMGGGSVAGEGGLIANMGNRALMDLCVMASKLAYENAQVIKSIVNNHWKMHFVDFYNCWNDFQKNECTKVFILCDKPKDANLVLVSFRGTEPFDADDWGTDFDFSWYEIPNLGKVHIGFLEALGLGNRVEPATFSRHLKVNNTQLSSGAEIGSSKGSTKSDSSSIASDVDRRGCDQSPDSEKLEKTAYYTVKGKLTSLLKEHKNAKFIVTGHSLGGALAIMFPTVLMLHQQMEIMERLEGVYTFGQPRIGNKQLGRFMEAHLVQRYFRVVYCNDLVPRLPCDDKIFLYKHFGECLYYSNLFMEKRMKEEPNRNFFGIRYLIPLHLNAAWELFRSLTMGYMYGPEYKEGWLSTLVRVTGLALPGISAHCLTNYVNSVRLGEECSIKMSSL
ncbi:hypothetical protein L6164_021316 [Bauhinia variegata]|uniref:Uncharacterized protein n=1 Tax=Bauhinia variegata TaxID=167791 RepID=A0ACB9MY50_BAUVA|nr:hypothetical protein L6164_021316 [Bauhinia variegata]